MRVRETESWNMPQKTVTHVSLLLGGELEAVHAKEMKLLSNSSK